MEDNARTDVSSSPNFTLACQNQITQEEKAECSLECAQAHSELFEQKVGSDSIGTVEELGDCKLSGCLDEKLLEVTASNTMDLKTQQLPSCPNNSVESCLIRENVSSQQTDQETACDLEHTQTHSESLEQKPKIGSECVGNEEGLCDCKLSGCVRENMIQVTESKIMDVNPQQLPTQPNNAVESSSIKGDLSSLQNVPQLEPEIVSACLSGDNVENACELAENVQDPPVEAVAVKRIENDAQPSPERGTHSSSIWKFLPINEDVPKTTSFEQVVQEPPVETSVQVPVEDESKQSVQVPVENESKQSVQVPVEDESKQSVQVPVEDESKQSVQVPVEDESKQSVQVPVEDESKQSIQVPVEDESKQSPGGRTCSSSNLKSLITDENLLNQPAMHSLGDNVNSDSPEPVLGGNEQSVGPSENAPNCDSSMLLCSSVDHPIIHPEDAACSNIEQLGAPSSCANQSPYGRRSKKIAKRSKRKYLLRSMGGSDRLLRPRNHEKSEEPESNTNTASVNKGHKKRRKRIIKKGSGEEVIDDEYTKIRKRLKYWLHRISYEQSFIDAYSGEGWKGQSVEKLKPEKELQRAASEILRRKLKIRDLFQHLDLLCAEGKFAQSLFDSEGQIDSEDIFCAKCGSKDLSSDNDIILCDGACDRGFHQFCLEPPLLSENIPPGDEGWLCPGCDCKDDCLDLLNEFQGTNLDITDSWERVFPEAAVIAAGKNVDHNFGLPSDEYDDGDYNPNAPEDEDTVGGGSSSDDTEYASAPEELGASGNQDPYAGLPSEDSEDDDYNPSALGIGNKETEEGSSSDFTSDSEDLAVVIEANRTSALDDNTSSGSLEVVAPAQGSGRRKMQSFVDEQHELSSLLEPDSQQDGCAIVSGRRHVERLDYKKLYDEAYSNAEHESSDDDDWTDIAPMRITKSAEIVAVSQNGKSPISAHKSKEDLNKPTRRTNRKSNIEDVNSSPEKPNECSSIPGSSGKRTGSSYRRLGESAIQRLYESFRENQYPDRTTKDSLAEELGLTLQQVSKWFENYRWSFRHHGKTPSQLPTGSTPSNEEAGKDRTVLNRCPVEAKNGHLSQECNKEGSSCLNNRKRKRASDPLPSDANHDVGESPSKPRVKSTVNNKVRKNGRIKTRRKR